MIILYAIILCLILFLLIYVSPNLEKQITSQCSIATEEKISMEERIGSALYTEDKLLSLQSTLKTTCIVIIVIIGFMGVKYGLSYWSDKRDEANLLSEIEKYTPKGYYKPSDMNFWEQVIRVNENILQEIESGQYQSRMMKIRKSATGSTTRSFFSERTWFS